MTGILFSAMPAADDRIVHGTGQVVASGSLEDEAARLLQRPGSCLCACPLGGQQLLHLPD